ncbi:Ethionine resistance protein [[Candida] zeylanoides]
MDDTAPLSNSTPIRYISSGSSCDDIDESEIISYIQHRRESIASTGVRSIPTGFVHSRNAARSVSESGAAGALGAGNGLTTMKSHASLARHSVIDVSDVLSHHNNELLAEPETNFRAEIRSLITYSAPLSVTFLLQYSLTVASVFSVGRLGSTELAAVSLASMTANISGYAIIQGVSTCLDTLCAQAYGRGDYNAVGLHFIRCTYFLFGLYVPMLVLWFALAHPLLASIIGVEGDQVQLVQLASDYLRILSIGLPGYILFENAKHFLQCQGIFHASTYVLCVCAPLNAFLNYFLVWNHRFGMGFKGAPTSVVITNWLMCAMLYGYIFAVDGYQCWPQGSIFSRACFSNWKRILDLSGPGVLMVEAEWLAFEIITFTASTFGTEVLAAQSIISTTCVLLYQIPFAVSIAISTRIAWYIGAASKSAAKTATKSAIIFSICVGMFNGGFLFVFRKWLASLFTNDAQVIDLASKVLIIGAAYQINDCIVCATNGVLRGQGRQKIGGYLNLFSYYCIALPLAFVFAFYYELELVGLWLGMIVALMVVSATQYYFVVVSDWNLIITECINDGIEEGGFNIDAHSVLPSMSSSVVV